VRKRRIGLYAAIGAAVLAAILGVAMFAGGGDKPKTVAVVEPVKPPPPQPPVVVEQPKPPPVVETKIETKVETPPPVVDTTAKKPVIKKQQPKPPIAPPPVEHVQQPKPPPVETKVTPLPAIYDANAFRTQWATVGQELKAFSTANGLSSVSDLQIRYSDIVYMSANASQASREAAKRELDAIHATLLARKK
jgi:outer membrane biosynthesis protein TonB